MDLSTYLAQVFGLLYTVVGVGIFINSEMYLKLLQEMHQNKLVIYFGGCASLVVGLSIVSFHNVTTVDWRGLITLIGWIALFKGVLLLTTPKTLLGVASFWEKNMKLAGIVTLVLGLYLGYNGFAG